MILFRMCNFTGANITDINYNLNAQTKNQIMYAAMIGCIALVCGYVRTAFLNLFAERQTRIIRQTLFESILKKDIEYFDTHKTGELNTCLTDDVNKIQNGIGDKLGTAIEIVSTFVSCLFIGKVCLCLECYQ
jgi:ATP-binding cassette subfamily B (MDR/TAP) protein 1